MDLGTANGIYYRNDGTHLGNYYGVHNGNNFGFQDQLKQIENIVTNGLVLNLNAANPRSYVSGSTSWYDLSGNGNTGTLTNGPTFNSSNGGNIVFDGTNQYVDNVGGLSSFSFIQNTNVFSINLWFKINDLSRSNILLGSSIDSTEKGVSFNFYRGLGSTFGDYNISCIVTYGVGNNFVSMGATNNNTITTNTWINACYVINNTTTGQWYLNGSPVTTSIRNSGQSVTNTKATGNSTRTFNIGRGNYSSTLNPLNGNISNVQIYNRALSATEVLQNYNALKYRYI